MKNITKNNNKSNKKRKIRQESNKKREKKGQQILIRAIRKQNEYKEREKTAQAQRAEKKNRRN